MISIPYHTYSRIIIIIIIGEFSETCPSPGVSNIHDTFKREHYVHFKTTYIYLGVRCSTCGVDIRRLITRTGPAAALVPIIFTLIPAAY